MKIDFNKKVSIHQMFETFLLFALPVICVCGASYFPYMLKGPLMVITGVVSVAYIVIAKVNIKLSFANILYIFFLLYLGVSLTYSYSPQATTRLLLMYLYVGPLLFVDLSENLCEKLIDVFLIIAVVIAVSIIISVPIDNCMDRFFWPIVNPGRSPQVSKILKNQLVKGIYTGFAREASEASYIMNVGLSACLAGFFVKGRLSSKELMGVITLIAGLLLTGKRMMFFVLVIAFLVLIMLVRMKGKTGKFVLILITAILCVAIILAFVPALANTFLRFADAEGIRSMGSREDLWEYGFLMTKKYRLFGAGFGSFNDFAFDCGLRSFGMRWEYNLHNSYFQAIGEIGVVGFILLFGFFVCSFAKVVYLVRNKQLNQTQQKIVYFSFYIQLMMLIYGVTGNPIYTRQIVFIWILSISMAFSISRKVTDKSKVRTFDIRREKE